MTKTNYTEPAVGWTEEDTTSGITKYGIVNYEYYNESVDVLSYVCKYTHVLDSILVYANGTTFIHLLHHFNWCVL